MNGRNIIAVFIVVAMLTVAFTRTPLQVQAQDCCYEWPMYRHDVCQSGFTLSPAPSTQPTTYRWKVETLGDVCSSAAVVDGKLYIGAGCSGQRTVLCLDVDTGFIIWNQTVIGTVCSSPAVYCGKVYIGTKYRDSGSCDPSVPPRGIAGVCCLDAKTGHILWNYTIGTGNATDFDMISSPVVVDCRVFIGGYCFDANTGELLWRYPKDTWYGWNSSPAVVCGKVYIGGENGNVTCLDANTGALIWNYTTDGRVWSSPAVVDGKVFVGTIREVHTIIDQSDRITYYGTVYCLDACTGDKIWNKTGDKEGAYIMSSAAVAYGNVYIGTSVDGKFYCLDEDTGNIKWAKETGGVIHHSSPAITDGKVYIGTHGNLSTDSGWLHCFDAYTGNLLWKYMIAPHSWGYVSSSPVLAYGMIFIAGDESILAFGAPTCPTAHVSIEHACRGDLIVDVGVADPACPDWCRRIWNGEGGSAHDLELTVDLSGAVAYLPPSECRRWFLKVYDRACGDQGRIVGFDINLCSTTYISTDVPVPIIGGQASYAHVCGVATRDPCLVVRGMDDGIYYRTWNGGGLGDWVVLPGSTMDSPAAAMLGNELHIVVRGSDGNSLWHGYLTNPADPGTFSGWAPLSGATDSAPTLTSNSAVLCLVVRGQDSRIYYRCYSGSWGIWRVIPTGATCDSPAAAMLGNDLHVVVRGMDGYSLWDVVVSCDGTVVRGWSLLSGATPSKPVLACSGSDNLCLVVRGLNNAVYYRSYTGSTDSWAGWSALPGATIDGPAATIAGNELCNVVRGSDGSTLWCGDIDLGTHNFSGWILISGSTPSAPTMTS